MAAIVPPILKSSQDISLYLERLGQGLTHAEAQVLSHLAEHGPCAISELHQTFGQKRSTLTSVLDRLVDRGLITRAVRSDDRRSFTVSLTIRGRAPATHLKTAVDRLEGEVLRRVKPRHVNGFRTLISAMDEALKSTEGKGE